MMVLARCPFLGGLALDRLAFTIKMSPGQAHVTGSFPGRGEARRRGRDRVAE